MVPTELKEAVKRVWARGWDPPEIAFHRKEFHGLVRACARLYPGMTPGKTYNPYQEAVENIFLNTPSRFYRKVEQRPEEAAEVIHRAFTQSKWPVTYLVPLDGCPSFPSIVRFGECEVGEFGREEFGKHIGESRLLANAFASGDPHDKKAEAIDAELHLLSQIQWLVVRGERSFDSLVRRILAGRPGSVGDIFSFGDISDGAETETDLVAAHSHGYPLPVERALFALAMCPWEEFVEDDGISWWRPFIVKWVHEVPHDPLARIYALPSADSLSWRINWSVDSKSGQERQYEIPMQVDYNPKGMATIAGDLSGIWKGIDAVWPVQRAAHPAFNSLVPHFILEAFRATGIDQLIFHNTAIDAALFTQGQGAKRDAGKSIATLLNKKAADSYFDLYDARSDYIHGRAFKRPLTYADLRAMRRVSRQVILRVLDLLRAHPEWTRRDYMNHLESLES